MKFEDALPYLRQGEKIARSSLTHPEEKYKSLMFKENNIYCSYYMTIYDILAEDWQVVNGS
jgi:hypothetical protein